MAWATPKPCRPPEHWALEYFAGSPYEWGGVTPCGVDCSGMVQTTFLARGLTLPRDSSQQAECGVPVPLDDARPGDLARPGRRIGEVAQFDLPVAGEHEALHGDSFSAG